jgi:hypothetical protein
LTLNILWLQFSAWLVANSQRIYDINLLAFCKLYWILMVNESVERFFFPARGVHLVNDQICIFHFALHSDPETASVKDSLEKNYNM